MNNKKRLNCQAQCPKERRLLRWAIRVARKAVVHVTGQRRRFASEQRLVVGRKAEGEPRLGARLHQMLLTGFMRLSDSHRHEGGIYTVSFALMAHEHFISTMSQHVHKQFGSTMRWVFVCSCIYCHDKLWNSLCYWMEALQGPLSGATHSTQ